MQDSPTISIILPVFNMEKCLDQTMRSLVDQSYSNFELICINDGSMDASLQILEEYAIKDERIRVYSQDNAGQGASRNKGLDLASGEYVMLLDADDIYDSDFITKMLNKADKTDADIVVCRSFELEDDTGRKRNASFTAKVEQIPEKECFSVVDMQDCIFTAFIGWPWDKLYKRSFIEGLSLRFPDIQNSEDLYFVFMSLVKARRIAFVDEELILHRIGRAGSVSNSRKSAPLAFYEAICMLKADLKKDPELYSMVSWGFLNWAFDYTIWNIESMHNDETKKFMIDELLRGNLKELELESRVKSYFSLEASDLYRLQSLCDEFGSGAQIDNINTAAKHPWLKYPVIFLNECRMRGFMSAFKKTFGKLTNANDGKRVDLADRGSLYFDLPKQ